MKLTSTLAAITALSFVFVSCDDHESHDDHQHKEKKGTGIPHDHDGDGSPDHGPGEHGKNQKDDKKVKPAVPHDHDGDGVPDHGPGAHGAHGSRNDHHGNSHTAKVAGPNGGRIFTAPDFKAEFFVTADKKVQITFLDDKNKAIPATDQKVNIIGGDRSNPTVLTPTKTSDSSSLISTESLPEGNNHPIIITIQVTPESTPARARFTLNLSDCPSCIYKEYACTCDHGH